MTEETQSARENRHNTASIGPDPRLLELLVALGSNADFKNYMAYIEARCTGLAVWAHALPDETQRLWAGGRVQEMADMLKLFNLRYTLLKTQVQKQGDQGV